MQRQYNLNNKISSLPNIWDLFAFILLGALLVLLGWSANQMHAPYHLGDATPISLDYRALPNYAMRTVFRMGLALIVSLIFSFTFGTLAAKSKQAERFIIPTIDIMQSLPIIGFLSITVVGFIRLFPGSMLGPECAAIFAIFTSQAWNMALSIYQSLRTIPQELREATDLLQLSAWQRFWRLEIPYATPALLWNTMISLSSGWFFVVASEAIFVSNQAIILPGIGSYISLAIQQKNLTAIGYAIVTMFIVILIYDQILFRPLLKWSEKFSLDEIGTDSGTSSWVFTLFRRTRIVNIISQKLGIFIDLLINIGSKRTHSNKSEKNKKHTYWHPSPLLLHRFWDALLLVSLIGSVGVLVYFIGTNLSLNEIGKVFFYGLITAIRVFVLITLCSFIWIPIGVWIGLRPKVAQIMQPVAQFLAAFPANLLFPLVVMVIVHYQLNAEIWTSPLMILGTQWYILFNVIVATMMIPKDIVLAGKNFGVKGWLWWRRIGLPAIFPYFITGALAAAGGAWNASILSEVVSWGDKTLIATGLGSYIAQHTETGDFHRIALGMGVMSIYVLGLNRLVWQKLYDYAQAKFQYS